MKKFLAIATIFAVSLTAAAVFAVLDQFTPDIGLAARQGSGFGIGMNQVGWGEKQRARSPKYN